MGHAKNSCELAEVLACYGCGDWIGVGWGMLTLCAMEIHPCTYKNLAKSHGVQTVKRCKNDGADS